jgi:serine/threonine protein kinase
MAGKNLPKMIKNYPIKSIIGKGGMGEVYLARHSTLKRDIILKRLKIRDKESQQRFLREAKVMLEFRHDNIVQVFDHFKEGTSTYIAMEYVKGMALNEIIAENEMLPPELALFIFYQAAMGLHHAHTKNVVHRDIKPHNILISVSGDIKIADFGIAAKRSNDTDGLTATGTIIGTPAYMSPEQYSSTKDVTYQSDIYSLGVVLYEMLTGVRPFKNEYSSDVIEAIARGKYTPVGKYVNKLPLIARRLLAHTFTPSTFRRYNTLLPAIKMLRRYFKKYNIFEIKDAVRRLMLKRKNIYESNFLQSVKKQSLKRRLVSTISLSLLGVGLAAGLFYYTDRYYEWIMPSKYGRVVLEFNKANMKEDYIFVGINNSYQRASFSEGQKRYRRVFYLPVGENSLSVSSGSYKNQRRVLVQPRTTQRKRRALKEGQVVNIPISPLWSQEVIVYFRFWDSLNNKLLFKFDTYSEKSIKELRKEDANLKIFEGKRYRPLKDYIESSINRKREPFKSVKKYYFLVDNFSRDGIDYIDKKFQETFSLDDRTVIVHVPLTQKPGTVRLVSNKKGTPILLNDSSAGLVFSEKGDYLHMPYKSLDYKENKRKGLYTTDIQVPPGNYRVKISDRGKVVTKTVKSGKTVTIDVRYERGKGYSY